MLMFTFAFKRSDGRVRCMRRVGAEPHTGGCMPRDPVDDSRGLRPGRMYSPVISWFLSGSEVVLKRHPARLYPRRVAAQNTRA
jgi:hypothetical protein